MSKVRDADIRLLMSDDCHRSKDKKDTFLHWLKQQPDHLDRRPTVEEVVKEMTRRKGALRSLVVQDHKEAAQAYWKAEAQYYLRHVECVRVDVRMEKTIGQPVRMYVPVRYSSGGKIDNDAYIPIKRVADNSTLKYDVLELAMSGLHTWLSRYEAETEFLKVFDPVIEAIREVEKELGSRDERSERMG